jgi:hypothetical protein
MGRIPTQILSSVYREAQNFQNREDTIALITLCNLESSSDAEAREHVDDRGEE